jgi:hypothetical protein
LSFDFSDPAYKKKQFEKFIIKTSIHSRKKFMKRKYLHLLVTAVLDNIGNSNLTLLTLSPLHQ